MNSAALKGMALTWQDYKAASTYEATRLLISKTDEGYEVTRGGKVVGVAKTREGAKELAGVL